MVAECLMSCHSMNSSIEFGLCICTGRAEPDSAVRCDVIFLTGSANIDIASGPLTTNI